MRRAVQAGINYAQLASQVMNGLYVTDTGMYASTAPYALTTQATDAAKAEQLLTADGWTASSAGGVRHKDGSTLAFTIDTYADQPDTQTLAVAMQAELSQIGFDVSVSQVPDIDAAQKNPTGWTSALEGDGTTSFAGDPITPLQEYFESNGASNTTGIDNPKLDSLINQLATTASRQRPGQPAQADPARSSPATRTASSSGNGCRLSSPPRLGGTTRCRGEPVGQRHDRADQLTRRRGAQVYRVPHRPGAADLVDHQRPGLGAAAARPGRSGPSVLAARGIAEPAAGADRGHATAARAERPGRAALLALAAGRAVHGDFGTSWQTGQPVMQEFATHLPATARLMISAMLIAVVIALVLGLAPAAAGGTWIDGSSARSPC